MVKVMKVIDVDLYNKLMTIFRNQKFQTDDTEKLVSTQMEKLAPSRITDSHSPVFSFDEMLEHARKRMKPNKKKKPKRYNKQRRQR